MNFRILCLVLGTTCLSVPALADCFDTPTWHDEPLTQLFLDGLGDGKEQDVRRASLTMLLMSKEPAREQRDELKFYLMRTALMQFDGDKGALRKKLQDGSLYDVIQLTDFSRSNPRDQSRIISAYWLNGCVEEALELLASTNNSLTSQYYMPIATGDAELLRSLAQRLEPGGYHQKRLITFAKLLESPDTKEETLQEFLDYLESERTGAESEDWIDSTGVKVALNVIRGQQPDLELLPTEPVYDPVELELSGMRFSAYVAWMGAAGFCEATWKTSFVLLGTPAKSMPFNRELLEASVIRCVENHDG
ncbi:hypothetical protein [Ruegeria faecimaris]|uniref:HEAT repeat-containing protein n=1 Tax=Ruegeria faecimaris TaxID=686389 RepID=A0A521EPC7_9RHOB|nr:hypothetical protein [Ruegeria faecimaris]SMO85291.1 hypothetical protein SAMN06265380_11263 [Ruegeria faecimaris]